MSRRVLVPLVTLGAALLIITGAIAGVLITGDEGDDAGRARSSRADGAGTGKGYLGLTVSTAVGGGLRVESVEPDGPAAAAGIRVADLIRSIDGEVLRTPSQLRDILADKDSGEEVALTIERGNRELRAEVTLGEAPLNAAIEATPALPSDAPQSRGRLGVTIHQITPPLKERYNLQRDAGVVVVDVAPESAAAMAGIEVGDIILAFGEDEIRSVGRLQRVVADAPADESIEIRVLRGTDELTLSASLPSQGEIEGFDILIPPELRDRLQRQLHRGELTRAEVEEIVRRYEERLDSVIAGTVESVDPGIAGGFVLTVRRYVGGESVSIDLNDETEIRRGLEVLQPADLGDGEIVLVLSMDNGRTAFSVHAFGILPE